MGKIFYLMGKSASGKDTVFKELLKRCPGLKTIVPYTTRPIRAGETDGVEYHFTDENGLREMTLGGKVIECRTYETVMGPWSYFTVDDGQIKKDGKDRYLMIGTLESYEKMREYFGEELLVPVYLEVPDGERLLRAVERESRQEHPNYREVCRRYLADDVDFSEEELGRLGIQKRYRSRSSEQSVEEILKTIALF